MVKMDPLVTLVNKEILVRLVTQVPLEMMDRLETQVNTKFYQQCGVSSHVHIFERNFAHIFTSI